MKTAKSFRKTFHRRYLKGFRIHFWFDCQISKIRVRDQFLGALTHLFSLHPYSFLMFSGCRERGHWEQRVNKKVEPTPIDLKNDAL